METSKEAIRKGIIRKAGEWTGTRYQFGGGSNQGIDCSHFVYEVFKAEVDPEMVYAATSGLLTSTAFADVLMPQTGDLVFWPGHVAIVVDGPGGNFIGAQTSTGVAQASFTKGYWAGQYGGKKPTKFRRSIKLM